jgi:hypothetical protein
MGHGLNGKDDQAFIFHLIWKGQRTSKGPGVCWMDTDPTQGVDQYCIRIWYNTAVLLSNITHKVLATDYFLHEAIWPVLWRGGMMLCIIQGKVVIFSKFPVCLLGFISLQ